MSEPNNEKAKPGSLKAKYVINGHDGVKHLIFHHESSSNGEFIVFVDKELDLDWECDDNFDAFIDTGPIKPALRKTLNAIAQLEPIAHNWPDDLKLSAKRLLGEAIVSELEGDAIGASAALANAQTFFKSKGRQVSRYWTLRASLVTGGIMAIIAILAVLSRNKLAEALGQVPFLLLLCFCAGCIGAVLFLVLRLGRQPHVDSTAERHLHYLEGAARIIGGGIAGMLVGCLVKLGLILPIFAKAGEETLAMCAAAMVAGASEHLAAGIITKVENNEPPKKEKANANH
ncbi:MAG TPA: hypothetical protein VFE51_17580 [Verrucomicrobiae bacterium]|nr:hypothetical protein [Verrucomicrobiae bacterium]